MLVRKELLGPPDEPLQGEHRPDHVFQGGLANGRGDIVDEFGALDKWPYKNDTQKVRIGVWGL